MRPYILAKHHINLDTIQMIQPLDFGQHLPDGDGNTHSGTIYVKFNGSEYMFSFQIGGKSHSEVKKAYNEFVEAWKYQP